MKVEKHIRYKKQFNKVEDYYNELINRTRETPQYLYFLIDAQYRAGKKKEALSNLDRAIKNPRAYT